MRTPSKARLISNHSICLKGSEISFREPELLDEDRSIIGAYAAACVPYGTGRLPELRYHAVHPYTSEVVIGYRDDVLSSEIMRVLDDVADIEHRAGDYIGLLE